MTQRIFVALLTVVVFMAGFAARIWTEPRAPIPPAPAALAKEYARTTPATADKKNDRQLDRAKLLAEIQHLRPEIDAFTGRVQEIEAEFDREFAQILRPDQKEKLIGNQKKWADRIAKRIAKREPLSLRRSKFIALYDGTPHPSIRLSRLAPLIERVGAPAK